GSASGWVLVDDGEVKPPLAWAPVTVTVRSPKVSSGVSVLRRGTAVPLTLHVRDGQDRPYDGTLLVDDGRVTVRGGRVLLWLKTDDLTSDWSARVRLLEGKWTTLDTMIRVPVEKSS